MSAKPNPVLSFPATAPRRKAAARQSKAIDPKPKIDQADRILLRLEERVEQIDRRIKQLQRSKQIALSKAERVENGAIAFLQQHRVKELIGNQVVLSTKDNPVKLVVDDPAKIPATYMRTIPESKEPDKVAIKVALQRGAGETATEAEIAAAASIGGCRLAQTVSLRRTR